MTDDTIHDPLFGQTLTWTATGSQTDGALLAADVDFARGGRVPRHVHLRQDERVEVTEGTILIRIGRRDHTLTAGETIDVPRRRMHAIRNVDEEESRLRLEIRPARRTEGGIRMMFAVSRAIARLLRRR